LNRSDKRVASAKALARDAHRQSDGRREQTKLIDATRVWAKSFSRRQSAQTYRQEDERENAAVRRRTLSNTEKVTARPLSNDKRFFH
jgi:hypothetical protein